MLAVARAMGETAPLLLTALGNDLFVETNPGKRMSTLSLQIFGSATGGFVNAQDRAWAGALALDRDRPAPHHHGQAHRPHDRRSADDHSGKARP